MRRAVYPGTFDPITNGHVDIIERAARIFDEVVVAAIDVPAHKSKTLFTTSERLELIEVATSHLDKVRVDSFSQLVVEYARRIEAMALVRGLRAITDFEYELQINQMNVHQDPGIESVYFMTSPQHSFVSSSGVKELAVFKGKVDDLVHPEVAQRLRSRLDV